MTSTVYNKLYGVNSNAHKKITGYQAANKLLLKSNTEDAVMDVFQYSNNLLMEEIKGMKRKIAALELKTTFMAKRIRTLETVNGDRDMFPPCSQPLSPESDISSPGIIMSVGDPNGVKSPNVSSSETESIYDNPEETEEPVYVNFDRPEAPQDSFDAICLTSDRESEEELEDFDDPISRARLRKKYGIVRPSLNFSKMSESQQCLY